MNIVKSREFIAVVILFFLISFIGTCVYKGVLDLDSALPLTFSILAAFFAYLTYLYSLEKMRLELLEKRWEVYKGVLHFISMVTKFGRIPRASELKDEDLKNEIIKALQAAHESFRGIGDHKVRSLFGPDIYPFFEQLNQVYADLSTPNGDTATNLIFIFKSLTELPNIFENYIYFGHITKNRFL